MIWLLDDGKITRQGSHEQLMKRRGACYRLFTSQMTIEEIV